MLKLIPILILATFSPTLLFPESANWSQWRGTGRNGKGDTRLEIDQAWTDSGPRLIWESSPIPSQDDGG
ncbi:MAG: hypothetical protein VCA18_10360, partial [Opitutales bacterium]